VKNNTDGMIDKILDQISHDSLMYLFNAIVFDAEWEVVYRVNQIEPRTFYNIDGSQSSVEMMISNESLFIDADNAKGFIKPYKNGDFSFVAILPDKDIDFYDFVESLSGESFLNLVNGAKSEGVGVFLPKFKYDFEVVMNDALQDMGMEKAFGSAADFSRMGKFAAGNLFIYEVLHKTHITVDERGTKAGAVTKVEVKLSSMETDHVTLDRPFVYAIIDNATKLPVFMGTVINFK
jgi:serpin B